MSADEEGYACYCLFGSPRPFIHINSVAYHARDARAYMGEAWAHAGENVRQGWRRAYKAGWRIVKVRVAAAESLLRFSV